MSIDAFLSAFTGNAQQRTQETDAATAQLNANTAELQRLMTKNEGEAAAFVAESGQVAVKSAALNYNIEKAKQANAALVGMNPEDTNNEMVRSMAAYTSEQESINQLEQQRAGALRVAEQMSSVNALESPLQYLVAQLALPTVAARHNTLLNQEIEAATRRDAAATNIDTRMKLLNARNSAVVANTADVANEIGLANAQLAQRRAELELSNMRMDNVSKLGTRALDAYRLSGEKYQVQSDIVNKAISLEQWKVQREQAAISRAAATEERVARIAARGEQDAERQLFNSQLAAASSALGYKTPITLTSLKQLPKDSQEQVIKVALSGKFGGNLLEGIGTVEGVGDPTVIAATNPGLAHFMRGAKVGIQNYIDEVNREIQTAKLPKNTKVLQEAESRYTQEVVNTLNMSSPKAINSATWDTTLLPYKPQYFTLLDMAKSGKLPELAGNSTVATLETIRAASPNKGADNLKGAEIEMLVKTVAQQVADGKLPADKAAKDLVTFHQAAAAYNYNFYNYAQFGLPKQTSTVVSIPPINMFATESKLDAMDFASAKKEVTKLAVELKKGTLGAAWQEVVRPILLSPLGGSKQFDEMIRKEQAAKQK